MHQSHAMMKKYRIVPGIIQLGVVIGVTQQKKKGWDSGLIELTSTVHSN